MRNRSISVCVCLFVTAVATVAIAQENPPPEPAAPAASDTAELAKQLANPVASLISVPFQFNYDQDIGFRDEGEKFQLNIQPVIPFALNDDWNLISRTIIPLVYQDDLLPDGDNQAGMGDILQSFFFSPKTPSANGIIWGLGPVLLFPTATDELLGGDQWAAGPTALVLKQSGHWTYGMLANHLWSYAGDDDKPDVNSTFLQPFLTYITPKAVSIVLNTESTYNWEKEDWAVPVNLQVNKTFKAGKQHMSAGVGVRYWLDPAEDGPEGWGFRAQFTLLFPRK